MHKNFHQQSPPGGAPNLSRGISLLSLPTTISLNLETRNYSSKWRRFRKEYCCTWCWSFHQ